jgi:Na+-driven multidrug efflux pump
MWPHPGMIARIYRVGGPSVLMMLINSFVIVAFNWFLGTFGHLAIAAYGLLFRIVQLFLMPVVGMSQGLMPIVGYSYGARNFQRLWRAVRTATAYATVVTVTAQALLLVFAPWFVRVFTSDPELLAMTTTAIRIVAIAMILVGAQLMWITAMQGMGHGGQAAVLSMLRQLGFLIPLMAVFSARFGMNGIWAAVPVADSLAFLAALWWTLRLWQRTREEASTASVSRPRDH